MHFDWFLLIISRRRHRDDVTIKHMLLFINISFKQIDFKLPWICTVIGHRRHQNVVRTSVINSITEQTLGNVESTCKKKKWIWTTWKLIIGTYLCYHSLIFKKTSSKTWFPCHRCRSVKGFPYNFQQSTEIVNDQMETKLWKQTWSSSCLFQKDFNSCFIVNVMLSV